MHTKTYEWHFAVLEREKRSVKEKKLTIISMVALMQFFQANVIPVNVSVTAWRIQCNENDRKQQKYDR